MSIQLSLDRARLVLRVVGWVGVLFSVFGLFAQNAIWSACPVSQQPPEIRPVYYTMVGVNIAITIATFFVAAGLTRAWAKCVPFFVGVQFLVLLDFLIPGLLWLNPRFGHAIATVTGISGYGTAFLVITLYPFWGSVAAIWAAHRMGMGQAHESS